MVGSRMNRLSHITLCSYKYEFLGVWILDRDNRMWNGNVVSFVEGINFNYTDGFTKETDPECMEITFSFTDIPDRIVSLDINQTTELLSELFN